MRKKLIAGNWKMNKVSATAADLARAIRELVQKPKCDVVVCVPFTNIECVKRVLTGSDICVGAQNISWADKGAFTGEISADMLIDAGAGYAIVGHSERRAMFGETDAVIFKRAKQALANDITPIVCVGETASEREEGRTETVLSAQFAGCFRGFSAKEMEKLVIAYEPVWAIGTGVTATTQQAEEAAGFIRSLAEKMFGNGKKVRILYGGSMNAANASALLSCLNIDGGLIGGASLIAEDFAAIVKAADKA